MNEERMDALLAEALDSGTIPAGASDEERAELARLLQARDVMRAASTATHAEADASMPAARARFQRYVAANRPSAVPTRPSGRRWGLGWARAPRGTMVRAGSAAAVLLMAVAAVVAWQVSGSGPTSAYAQVVNPGDYVQVQGVVGETRDGSLSLHSELGDVEVVFDEATTVVDSVSTQEVSGLKRGDHVLVSGIAGRDRRLMAQTLAVGGSTEEEPPKVISFRELKRLQPELRGSIVTYTISSDGTRGTVLIDAGEDERYLVRVDAASAAQLLERASTALGQEVSVVEESGVTSGTFTLDVPPIAPPEGTPAPERPGQRPDASDRQVPALVRLSGVVSGVASRPGATEDSERILEGLVTIETVRGPAEVMVRPTTRVLPGRSGLQPGAGARGEATGHIVYVSGGLDRQSGRVVADVIVMGEKPGEPARR